MNILKINGQALEGIYVDAAISFNKPAKRVSTYSVPGRNGDLVIDEGTFDNVLITYPVFEKSTFPTEFDEIVNYLASLEGYQKIECSNDPQHYRLGRFVVPQNPTAKRLNRDGYWQLSFDCKPQRWLLSGEEDTEIDANPIDEYSGDIVSIDAVALDEITELKAAIEPVQNLNGQASPYPAGGGKNLLDYANIETAGTSVGIQCDSNGNISDSSPTGDSRAYNYAASNWKITLEAGTYTFSWIVSNACTNTNGTVRIYDSDGNILFIGRLYRSAGSHSKTLTLNASTNIGIITKIYDAVLKFQIESGSSATAWTPYSNICPISGHTEVNVYRTGVNVWDEEWENGAIVNGADEASTATIRSKNYCGCKPSTTYYIKSPSSIFLNWYDANKAFIERSSGIGNATITSPSNACYFRIGGSSNYGNTYNNDISINYPSTDNDYHAYAGQTYPISLGQTVYGGTLNVTTGVLTIDRKELDLGSLGWVKSSTVTNGFVATSGLPDWYEQAPNNTTAIPAISDTYTATSYNNWLYGVSGKMSYREALSGKGLAICDASLASYYQNFDAAAFALAVAGKKIVYTLATPTTVQLTVEEVELLLGQNNIWADTGDVEVKVTTPTVFNNPSLFNSKPLIRVYGVGTFRVNDITVTIASHDKPYIDIDCELQECYYGSENMNEYVSFSGNDFPELQPGDNYMLLASGITKLIVTPRWWVL